MNIAKNCAIKVILYNSISPFFFDSKFFKIIAQRRLTKGIEISNIITIMEINNPVLETIKSTDASVNFLVEIRYVRVRVSARNFSKRNTIL